MNSIFETKNYREIIEDFLSLQPAKGFGTLKRICIHAQMNQSLLSQVMKSKKELTPEQANDVADFMGLSDVEAEYFLSLVQWERAGKNSYKDRLSRKIEDLRKRADSLKERIPSDKELSDTAKAVFYSHWYYSATRILTSIEEFRSLDALSKKTGLSISQTRRVVDFLVREGLCKQSNNGITIGPKSTHVDRESNHVARHHANWRMKSIQALETDSKDNFMFTSPVSLSKDDFEKLKKLLSSSVEKSFKIIEPSEPEVAACLIIDLFKL